MTDRRHSPAVVNQVEQCKKRAAACMHEAFFLNDDMLREAYVQLAQHWHAIAERLDQKQLSASVPTGNEAVRKSLYY